MKLLHIIGAGLAAIMLSTAAFAADTTITLPVGSWLGAASEMIGPILAAAFMFMIRKLPSQVAAFLMTMRVDQLLQMAISYGINAVSGATKDKPLTIDVGNEVVARAAQYAIDNAPGWLVSWMGGVQGVREKIIARLDVEPSASIQ